MGYLILFWEAIFIVIGLTTLYISRPSQSPPTYTVLLIRDSEDYIEGIVRNLTKTFQNKARLHTNDKLLILDLGSSDDTFSILKILAKDYNFIKILYVPKVSGIK